MPAPSSPGIGHIVARLLPPSRLVLPTLTFQYPLKLISSALPTAQCLTVFILSYGGGLVSNDTIHLSATIETGAKLCLLTQGSTKVFRRVQPSHLTQQELHVTLHARSALLLLPDPIAPFADSAYRQTQRFYLPADDTASIIMLDWLTEGRSASGEKWDFHAFVSRNEFFLPREDGSQRLMLRDAMVLERVGVEEEAELRDRMEGMAVFATLVIRGPMFKLLEAEILQRFREEPRIGNRNWDDGKVEKRRWEGVVWTAARVRGFVLVKVGGRSLQEVRGFLRMLLEEGEGGRGEVVGKFGEGCLLCLQ